MITNSDDTTAAWRRGDVLIHHRGGVQESRSVLLWSGVTGKLVVELSRERDKYVRGVYLSEGSARCLPLGRAARM